MLVLMSAMIAALICSCSFGHARASLLITSNLPFSEWGQIFQGERMTAALLDRLTHHCHIFELNGESYRFRESVKKNKQAQK